MILKLWIGILAILLPIGIVNGIVQRALLPTSVGVAINLSMMYLASKGITADAQTHPFVTQSPPDISDLAESAYVVPAKTNEKIPQSCTGLHRIANHSLC